MATEAEVRGMRAFFTIWSGQALSLIGSQAVQFALVWWLTLRTGSAAILATATFVALAPQVLLGPLSGALVDRWSRRWTMLISDAAVAAASALLAWLFLAGVAEPAHVLLLLFVRAVGGAFHGPAMLASTSLMVPVRHLTRIQGFNQMLQGGLSIIAAPLGAMIYGLMSMPGVMMVDVATALFAIVPLLFVPVPEPVRQADPGAAGPSLWREMAAGFRYLRERRGHLALIGMASVLNLCLVPAFALLPLLVSGRLGGGAADLAWLSSLFGAGTIAGGIALGSWGGGRRRIVTALAGIVGLGGATLGLALVPASFFPGVAVALFLVGASVPMANGPILAIMQSTIAPDFQGRVFTLMGSLGGAMAPLGLLLATPIADLLGVRAWYVAAGGACVLLGAASFFVRPIMEIEAGETTPEPASA
jgi:DHA3 family macrolide efflux protein-like MFS transporter